jgi:hypothetical protein
MVRIVFCQFRFGFARTEGAPTLDGDLNRTARRAYVFVRVVGVNMFTACAFYLSHGHAVTLDTPLPL